MVVPETGRILNAETADKLTLEAFAEKMRTTEEFVVETLGRTGE